MGRPFSASPSIATTTSPRVGEILGSGLDPALRCVQLWPRDALTRQRVVAYFQRLVTTTGARVFPYVSPLVEHMRHGASAVELRECLVLINQLSQHIILSGGKRLRPLQRFAVFCALLGVAHELWLTQAFSWVTLVAALGLAGHKTCPLRFLLDFLTRNFVIE